MLTSSWVRNTGGSTAPRSRSLPHKMTNVGAPPARALPATSGVTRFPLRPGGPTEGACAGEGSAGSARPPSCGANLVGASRVGGSRGRFAREGWSSWCFCAPCCGHFSARASPRLSPRTQTGTGQCHRLAWTPPGRRAFLPPSVTRGTCPSAGAQPTSGPSGPCSGSQRWPGLTARCSVHPGSAPAALPSEPARWSSPLPHPPGSEHWMFHRVHTNHSQDALWAPVLSKSRGWASPGVLCTQHRQLGGFG